MAAKKKSTRSTARSGSRGRAGGGRASGLGTRPVWSGSLRLALVTVPVKLYPATKTGARISFHQVHEPSGKRVRYEKVVPGIGPVDREEIVKGFDLGKGRYVLFDEDEIDALKVEHRHTLDLVQFVDQGEIGAIWYDRPYYVVADGDLAEEAYGVLRQALRASGQVGLGQFVMRGREHIGALRPCGSGLLLETLRFADEVREAAPFFAGIDAPEADEELLQLATELIERKSGGFDPSQFKDAYTVALRELIDAKSKKQSVEIDEDERPAADSGGKVIDLVEALKRSVKQAEKPATKRRSSSGSRRKAS
ncbi:MAG: Ku protein [Alphaproteobacteria bacterium]